MRCFSPFFSYNTLHFTLQNIPYWYVSLVILIYIAPSQEILHHYFVIIHYISPLQDSPCWYLCLVIVFYIASSQEIFHHYFVIIHYISPLQDIPCWYFCLVIVFYIAPCQEMYCLNQGSATCDLQGMFVALKAPLHLQFMRPDTRVSASKTRRDEYRCSITVITAGKQFVS